MATLTILLPAPPAVAAVPDPPRALPANATEADAKWQPALDYDGEACYNVPAIGPDGTIAEGLDNNYTTSSADCRDESDLRNTNAYSRQRCNSGWCAYLYDYYFEKDVAVQNVSDPGGHRHDWEHIVVWVQNDVAKHVAVSEHGNYIIRPANEVRWEGNHPKVVYHKQGGSTHAFRFARADDDDDPMDEDPAKRKQPENHDHIWQLSPLVSYNGFPEGLRESLFAHDFGTASIALKDSSFPNNLKGALPQRVLTCPWPRQGCVEGQEPLFDFDFDRDENSPGTLLKVMVVGDSMSQGDEGDWTWRYRLWEWFRAQNVTVDFVGPYVGTVPAEEPTAPARPPLQGTLPPAPVPGKTSGGYDERAAVNFDSDHFALWGRQAAVAKTLIKEQVSRYQPDLLLVGLGFNDMGWWVSDADGTLTSMKTLVDQARAAKPNLKFALANVPQRTAIGNREDLPVKTDTYNRLLAAAIPTWNTAQSPVALVDWRGNYDCEVSGCPAGYDGLHPNALGEYQIAQAFSRTLRERYGVGGADLAIPAQMPPRPTPVPSDVVAESSPLGVVVSWKPVYGAHGYDVRARVAGQPWAESHYNVSTHRHYTTWTSSGLTWEYQVRTDNGDVVSAWSPMVSAVSRPQTAKGPAGIVTRATATGVDVTWGASTGPYSDTIDRYEVLVFDQDTPGAWLSGTAVTGLTAHVDGLIPGHRYTVAVASWNAVGGGLPAVARPVTIGGGTPAAPTGLRVSSTDATTVQLTWTGASQAAGYRVWVRNINDGSQSSASEGIVTGTTHGISFLFPGVWNYEFCVSSVNGVLESGKSTCVVAARPAGS
ncbi:MULTISPECIES: NPP1 family protein [Micromonospora]|nr:NPP1 family protein [Micromonospora sp. C81]WTE89586.1 NPP1 family protein [Micromonospora zamorensis]WTI24366.1 NPP1 family protein [Micromonospora zamorensis]